MPRFAANIAYMFTERASLLERVGAAAQAGFKAIELQFPYDVPPATLRAEIEKHGLTVLGLNTERGGEGEFGLAAVPGRETEFKELFATALDYIVDVGGRSVHCLAGRIAPELRAAAHKTFVSNLRHAADLAAKRNIFLLIEPINNIERPNYFLNYVEQAAEIISAVGRDNVKIQFDFYHVQIMQGHLIRRFEKHQPLVGHIQIAAVPSRNEPDEGEIHHPEIFKALDRLGWTDWIACEYRPRARTEDGLGWARPYGVVPKA
ncbi:MAG TPA: TIM barrel protein [Pseudolabrys sp.]|nr:TIM barrel protein [Pseudolabrys sp.]